MRRALLVIAATAGLAGCGPSEAFVDDMNAVCVRFDRPSRDVNARTRELEGRPRDARFLRDLAPVLEDSVALNGEVEQAIRGVAAPEEVDRRKRDRAAERIDEQARLLGQLATAARAGDTDRFADLQDDLQRAAVDRQRAVIKLEAERCLY